METLVGIGSKLTQLTTTRGKAMAILAGFLAAGLVAALIVRWSGPEAAHGCAGGTTVTVAADPRIAPAVERVVSGGKAIESGGTCVQPHVRAAGSSAVKDDLTSDGGDRERPDLWIPDSAVWLSLADAGDADARSIAASPVVLATTEKAARESGWPQRQPAWSGIFAGSGRVGATAPSAETGTMFALAGMDHLGLPQVERDEAAVAMARRSLEDPATSFEHLPGGVAKPTVAAFPTSEQAVVRHNDGGKGASVVAAYPDKPTPWLDYPAAVLAGSETRAGQAALAVRDELLSERGRKILGEQGFRTPKGELTGDGAADSRVADDPGSPAKVPGSRAATKLFQRWATSSSNARMLVAVDVSGSMKSPVPGTNLTRAQVTGQAVTEGLRLLRDDSVVTVWEFSSDRQGHQQPYREVAGWKPVREHIADRLPERFGELISQPGGYTPLFDTTLAAVEEAKAGWEPEALNIVVVLTDGKNAFPEGLSRKELIGKLGDTMDEDRPTSVIFIGLGTDVDPKELNAVAEATGGQAHLSADVAQVRDLYFKTLRGLAERR